MDLLMTKLFLLGWDIDVNPLLAGDCLQCWVGSGVPQPLEERGRTWRLKAAPAGIEIGITGRRNVHWGNRLFSRRPGSWTVAPQG